MKFQLEIEHKLRESRETIVNKLLYSHLRFSAFEFPVKIS
jgi:hypothetical protein